MEPFVPRLVLVPTDFSEPAAHALRYASALAERFGAHLLVIHADPFVPVMDFTAMPAAVFGKLQESMIDNAREALQTHAEENISETVPFDLRVIVGDTIHSIVMQIQESGANLVVMGTHGRTGVSRLLFGSVTESMMRTSTIPVIAVNPAAPENARIGKVVCPVTFTAASREAVRCAAALLESDTAPLVLVHSIDAGDATLPSLARMRKWAPRELAGRCEMRLTTAGEAGEIVSVAQEAGADLIALGVQPSVSIHEELHGTLAERIVQQSTCAVLTMNEKAAAVRESPATGHQLESVR
jgi:universal stress protein A